MSKKKGKNKQDSQPAKKQAFLSGLYRENYKSLLYISLILLVFSLVIIGIQLVKTGDFADKGVSLKGGIVLTILSDTELDVEETQVFLKQELPNIDAQIRITKERGVQQSVIIEAADVTSEELIDTLKNKYPELEDKNNYSLDETDPVLGTISFNQLMVGILIAFLFMAIVVFLYFRMLVVSGAIVLAALSDILFAVAGLNLFGIKLTMAGVAAFIMLIGYSVDTDIMLSVRVLKRKEGEIFDRVIGAMKTGLTMSGATLAVVIIALIFTDSDIIKQIMTVLLFGLIADLIYTWIQNAGILRWYLERKQR